MHADRRLAGVLDQLDRMISDRLVVGSATHRTRRERDRIRHVVSYSLHSCVRAIRSGQSPCGHCEKENRPSQAVFRCRRCGHEAHADVNAAVKTLRGGLAQRALREAHKKAA